MKNWTNFDEIEARFDSRTGEKIPDRITRWIIADQNKSTPICLMHKGSHSDGDFQKHTNLVAAAPDMYDSLIAIKALAPPQATHIHRVIDDVLAKARGEQ